MVRSCSVEGLDAAIDRAGVGEAAAGAGDVAVRNVEWLGKLGEAPSGTVAVFGETTRSV